MVDVEADGPCPGLYSMTELGVVVIREDMEVEDMPSFYGKLAPLPDAEWMQEALDVCGRTREETEGWTNPLHTMQAFQGFLEKFGGARPMFVSDNNGFDYQFVNYYCWKFLGKNPFGHSSMNLGSLFKGMQKNTIPSFKYLRKTKHTHHPVDDCRGNVEALLHMKREMELRIKLK
jgi:hypothetical protein